MSEQTQGNAPDVMQLWRDWLTESERQFNSFLSDAMGADPAARSLGGFLETYASLQRLVGEAMQRYLTFVNMPSRTDVVGLGETLRAIEERLTRIEETLQLAAQAVDASERPPPTVREPLRTRQPAAVTFPQRPADGVAIPEELRR